jgi:hypothetical protein
MVTPPILIAVTIPSRQEEPLAQNSARNSMSRRGNPDKIKPFQFKPGQSGNPGGRPRGDLARELARAIFREQFGTHLRNYAEGAQEGRS